MPHNPLPLIQKEKHSAASALNANVESRPEGAIVDVHALPLLSMELSRALGGQAGWPSALTVVVADYFVSPETGQAFLQHIAYGEQEEAEALLKVDPALALYEGDVTDYSERTFAHITGFQYAVWALDWHMWTMLLRYLPEGQAAEQLRCWDAAPQDGQVYSFEPLLEAYRAYLDEYEVLYKTNNRHFLYMLWVRGVGWEQQECPAHVLLEYTTKDRSLYPVPDFTIQGRPTPHAKYHVKWVFTNKDNGGIANSWALARCFEREGWDAAADDLLDQEGASSDFASMKILSNTRKAQWTSLREQLLAPQGDAGLGAHA